MPTFSDDKGFTVVEAMVAMTILTVGVLAVGTMLRVSMYYDTSSNQARIGNAVAQEIIEELKGDIASSSLIQMSVDNIAGVRLTDPKFVYGTTYINDVSHGCPSGVNCVQQIGVYGEMPYKWQLNDRPDPASNPTGQTWANTWRLQVTVGWGDCTGTDPSTCTYTTQITSFLVPLPIGANP